MMAELVFSPTLWYGVMAGAVAFAALASFAKKRFLLWALLSGLCETAGILLALLQGRTLGDALPAVLAAAAVALVGLCGKGDGA